MPAAPLPQYALASVCLTSYCSSTALTANTSHVSFKKRSVSASLFYVSIFLLTI